MLFDWFFMLYRKFRSPRTATGLQIQYGALPFRHQPCGHLEVLLVTSRGTGRWIIPKGWPLKKGSPADAARAEAYEEAGIEGRLIAEPVGRYNYLKWTPHVLIPCEVTVFGMKVDKELDEWPEKKERERRWFSRDEAAALVAEADLAAIIRGFKATL